jgi:hypothetical protein
VSPRKKRINQKPEAVPAEFPDTSEINAGANYDVIDPLLITNPDPNMHYYFAADDGDRTRPDGVARLKQMGYRESDKQHGSPDCKLLEIPMEIYEKRQSASAQRNAENQRAVMEPPNGLEVVRKDHGIRSK